jgi:hypothetical protein
MNLTSLTVVLLAPAIALIAIPDSRAQAPYFYELDALPAGATLHRVEATPAEYKGRKAIKVEMPDAAIKAQLGIDVGMPTFVRIPVDFQNGTIEVNILSRLNGKGPPDARAWRLGPPLARSALANVPERCEHQNLLPLPQ